MFRSCFSEAERRDSAGDEYFAIPVAKSGQEEPRLDEATDEEVPGWRDQITVRGSFAGHSTSYLPAAFVHELHHAR